MNNQTPENPFALSIGDLMAALLLIFILLLSATLLRLQEEFDRKSQIAENYRDLQQDLYLDLMDEFKEDLEAWNAVLDRETLSIRFKEPDILFEAGEYYPKDAFKEILDDFFPRYIRILRTDKYIDNIEEIRIEGHTSSEFSAKASETVAYFYNMKLSQNRTRKVLEYVIELLPEGEILDWAKFRITANGLASSKLVYNPDGTENMEASRRVEFRVRTNAEDQIREMLRMAESKN